MTKTILFILLNTIIFFSARAQNKVDGKGQRKGDWFIAYKGDFTYYDYSKKILNLDKMLSTSNETEKNDDARYFEKVEYKKGIKQGDFVIYNAEIVKGQYLPIAMGIYTDGKINGKLSMISNLNMIGYPSRQISCSMQYESGKIKDQDVLIEEKRNYGEIFKLFGSQKVYPIITIKNGVCIDEIITCFPGNLNRIQLLRYVKTNNGFTEYLYQEDLLRGLINVKNGLQITQLDNNFIRNGVVSIYAETAVAFDTSLLHYSATFKNGKKDGAEFWYDAKNGNIGMECTYVEGLLSGVSKLYTKNGQIWVEANYTSGLLNGKYINYFISGVSQNLVLKGPLCEVVKNVNIYDIMLNNANQDIFNKTIPMFKKEGFKIVTDGDFKFYEANYENGKIVGVISYYHSNGKKLYEGIVSECKESDWKWLDKDGQVILDKTLSNQNDKKKQELQNKELIELYNSEIPCAACNNPILYKNSKSNNGECHCIQKNGEPITVLIREAKFCSIQCKIVYEKDQCLDSGYRH